ncbi:aromatic amino acid lyase [Streptomyces milbemycinicus]|uniref:Aromatic amino acid lyase n=1 Tax=Streptomyces milbemycinicus TaxID=476552 RepID=A0ABW8M506_9ACTN
MLLAVEISGSQLTIEDVVAVARHHAPVELGPSVEERMRCTRRIVDDAVKRGDRVYGLTTSVGAKTGLELQHRHLAEFNRRILRTHHVGHGPLASEDIVRATMVILLNAMASGSPGVRPELARVIVDALNSRRTVAVHLRGSMGQSDMSSMSDLALGLFEDMDLIPGEGLALVNSSAFSTALGALALADLAALLDSFTLVGALSMEGYAANPSIVTEAALISRPFSGLQTHGRRVRTYLEGSYLWQQGGPRHLQDPLCFRSIPLIHGAAADGLAHARGQVAIELNAAQCNPVVSQRENRLVAAANFDMVSLTMALDFARLAFSPVVTSSTERLAKMTDSFWSGLSAGLVEEDGVGATGFNGVALFHKSITSEARLLTVPLVGELSSSSHSNGNMDRASMAALGGRRAAELVELCRSIAAMELLVAAQAAELRGRTPLGAGTGALFELVRERVPFAQAGHPPPHIEPLLDFVTTELPGFVTEAAEAHA